MSHKTARISASELERETGVSRQAAVPILRAAGLKSSKTAGGVTYPRAAALAALAPHADEAAIIKDARDRMARAKAAMIDIRVGLREGRYVTTDAHLAAVDALAANFALLKNLPGRYARQVAEINASARTEDERVARLQALLAPEFDQLLKNNWRLATWQEQPK